ncbi:MAG TPA: helix-turn-helix domain-containing protein [Kofleriaceae bacterium]|nr:helix-turn-helix domain-containing protein [Kofleriaceae bacterium]
MHDARPCIDLLLAHADDRAPMLPGVAGTAASAAPAPEPRPKPDALWADEAAPDDLVRQRWGVIAPAGGDGDRLLDAIAPLVEHRRRQQGPVRVYRVPAQMTVDESVRWKKRVYRTGADLDGDLPRYQLILGDLDQVPLAVQQVQASDGFVGRIAFDDLDGYRAYAAKVVRWEDRPAPVTEAHAILHAVRDGTSATRLGVQALIAPGAELLRARRIAGDVRYGELRVTGSERPAPDELWAAAAIDRPGVLLSLGHGAGVPRSGGASRQRREQGALSFGGAGLLTGADLAGRGFLPGGVWLAVACFAAGTPDTSAYRHWLDALRRAGHVGSEAGHVLDTLAHDRPFVAALPRAALADPDGPLAFVGHIDLAWAYSFFDLDDRPRRRPARIAGVIQALLNGHRAGVAVRRLMHWFAEVNTELTALDDARARTGGAPDDPERVRRGHLWMLRQDLAGYVLLGDPAIRLPILGGRDAASALRAGGETRSDGGHASPAACAEAAVLAVLRGDPVADAARRHGLDRAELDRLVAIYRAAGRVALEAAIPERGP